jgi:hypothetical protein
MRFNLSLITLVIALAAASVMAEPPPPDSYETITPDGAYLLLKDEKGICLGHGRAAVWTSKDGTVIMPGCWRVVGVNVSVMFLDVESLVAPISDFRLVKPL